MFDSFNKAWTKEKKKGIADNADTEKYWDYLSQIEGSKPEWESFKVPEKGIQKALYLVATSKYLENTIMAVIILNMITMAMSYDGSSPFYNNILDKVGLCFTAIFIAECIIKLLAFNIQGYFYYTWNRFDFFVVASSIVDLVVTNTTSANSTFLKSFQIIRVLRVLRVTRVLRLVKSLKGLEALIQTLRWSMTALGNVFILMFLVFCIFSIMGCYLYDGVTFAQYSSNFQNVNEYYNLDNFYNSFLLCFRQLTGENWPVIMLELAFGKHFN